MIFFGYMHGTQSIIDPVSIYFIQGCWRNGDCDSGQACKNKICINYEKVKSQENCVFPIQPNIAARDLKNSQTKCECSVILNGWSFSERLLAAQWRGRGGKLPIQIFLNNLIRMYTILFSNCEVNSTERLDVYPIRQLANWSSFHSIHSWSVFKIYISNVIRIKADRQTNDAICQKTLVKTQYWKEAMKLLQIPFLKTWWFLKNLKVFVFIYSSWNNWRKG